MPPPPAFSSSRPCHACRSVCIWQRAAVFLAAAALASFVSTGEAAVAKKASFGVRAKVLSDWPQTAMAAQSMEWLRDIGAAEAVAFLRQLASASNGSMAMEIAEAQIQSGSVRTFHELLVRNSYYSPLIEMLRSFERGHRRQFGSACKPGIAWALVWTDRSALPVAACEAKSLRPLLSGKVRSSDADAGEGGIFVPSQMDHILQAGRNQGPVVIVYGALVPQALKGLAALLKEVEAAAATWRIIFRHADSPAGPDGPVRDLLTGWGFEMAIKSSEYKTHADESKDGESKEGEEVDAAGESGTESEYGDVKQEEKELDGPLELDGLEFHTLLKRNPTLRSHLWAFKEQLEVERDTDVVLKAWEINNIGLQATARIKSSTTPLVALMRLSQNFPAHVVGLSRTTVPDTLKKSMGKLRQTIRAGAEVFSLNGRLVRPDHSDLSLFPMMQSLLPYFVGIERLVRIGLPEAVACELLKDSSRNVPPERLDWRSPHLPPVLYHVQKDKKTQQWGNSLQHLMYAMQGGLAPIRMPLFNMVFTFDPAEVSDLAAAAGVLAQAPLPMALHFVMISKKRSAMDSKWDEQVLGKVPDWLLQGETASSDSRGESDRISRIIASAFTSILQKNPKKARIFLKKLAEAAKTAADKRWPGTDEGIDKLHAVWRDHYQADEGGDASKDWSEIVSDSGAFAGLTENATKYATQLGLPVPSMLVNGKLLLKGAYEGNNIYQTIGSEQQNFMRALYMGELQEEDGLEDFIASQGLLSAYHQDITPEVGQRGGEGGMPGNTVDVNYLQWPSGPFKALSFLKSIEPEYDINKPEKEGLARSTESTINSWEGLPDGRLSFFHVIVLRRLDHAYLLHTFASHMLAPDRALLASNKKIGVPPLLSHWTVLVDSGSTGSESDALAELAACVSGAIYSEASDEELNRQKLGLLKFLGAAVPAAAGASGLAPAHMRDICELAVSKKIDPDHHQKMKASIEASRSSSMREAVEKELFAAAAAAGGKDDSTALWVCNGRQITLEADLSPRHVQALELIEAQYDISQLEGEVEDQGGGMMMMMGMFGGRGQPQKGPPPPRVKPLYERLAKIAENGSKELAQQLHGLVASIRSEAFASSFGRGERFDQPQEIFDHAPAAFKLKIPPARPEAASPITVYGIVDPLSTTAQSASAVLALFGMTFNAEVNLLLNPNSRLSEYPLKRYYREVIRWPERLADGRRVSELDDGGGDVGSGEAEFASLVTKHTLTAAMHTLPTWLTTAHEAVHDMDNLRLADVGNGQWCETTYILQQLYVEGQAFVLGEDGWPVAPAKGLELNVMDASGQDAMDDTIVMGNLGYFQVSGNPGVYGIRPKPGLSNETCEVAVGSSVEVASYITPPYQLRVRLRPGHKIEDLEKERGRLPGGRSEDGGKKAGSGALSRFFGGLRSMWGKEGSGDSKPSQALQKTEGADIDDSLPTIHIFSVASGHLYEKLLGIMILSVRKTTRCPLHFWFISNFLSPKFKKFIPDLARRYKFNFDFVTYKWPSWLNPQSEKQRLIWAYKILFLDVLFPLDVPKIIFIDADQVVRSDVRELWDADLEGKVYGFVPMGDTNTATEGFRFWKQGYWKNHLGELSYHISALFVVDLIEFRRSSTGDQLRGIYNQLSRDPNSLANLDQDLPNFAQHQVAIHSLPAEWLWCETWCSQESKPKAKTIDLCQNPLTKEPKIVMAQRIISEWKTYHDEVQRCQAEVEAEGAAEIAPPPSNKAGSVGKGDEL